MERNEIQCEARKEGRKERKGKERKRKGGREEGFGGREERKKQMKITKH